MNTNPDGHLPPVNEQRKGEIALKLMTERVLRESQLLPNPNSTRRSIVAEALRLDIDPNELLSMLHEIVKPRYEELFKPLSPQAIEEYKKQQQEEAERRAAAKATKVATGSVRMN